jgi:integrase
MAVQRGSVAASTMEKYILHLSRWHEELGDGFAFRDLSTERVMLARQSLVKRLSPRTVNGSMQTLRRVLAFAIDMGWIGVIPWRKVKQLTEAEFKPQWWTPDQAALALQIAAQDRHQPTALLMLVLGVMIGLRKDEAVNLRWQDLVLDRVDGTTGKPAPVCHIRCDAGWKPKGRRPRDIPISDQCLDLLSPHRKESGYVLVPERVLKKRGGTKRVYRWDCDKVWDRVLVVAVQQGLPEIRFHDLRHSFASNLLGAGVSAEKVAEWLGHKDTRLVHTTYGHLLSYDAEINRVNYQRLAPAQPSTK